MENYMIRTAWLGLALALSSACVTTTTSHDPGDAGSPDPGKDAGSDSGPSSVSPRAGKWFYDETTKVSSTCSSTTPIGEAGAFVIDQVTPGSFRITPGDGSAPFTCTTTTTKFSCPNRASFVSDLRPSVDAVVTGHATAEGKFSDATHGSGSQHATVDCVGTQCALVGPMPCNFAVDFKILAL
jgi:hypothetical protein